jgi:transcription elongation factor GreB
MTARGATRLRAELEELRRTQSQPQRIAELETLLASVTVVQPVTERSDSIAFGATVTVDDNEGAAQTYTVVGVDEVEFYPDGVSWISPFGKTLLAAGLGDKVKLGNGRTATIVKID